MNTFVNYVQEAIAELHKVRWPTRQQAIKLSIIVIGFTAVSSLALGAVDFVLAELVSYFISL